MAALGCGLVATTRTEFGMSNLARVHAVKKNVVEILIFISRSLKRLFHVIFREAYCFKSGYTSNKNNREYPGLSYLLIQ
jgi:hypothetical protein